MGLDSPKPKLFPANFALIFSGKKSREWTRVKGEPEGTQEGYGFLTRVEGVDGGYEVLEWTRESESREGTQETYKKQKHKAPLEF